MVLLGFLWAYFAYHAGVRDVTAVIYWNGMKVDGAEGVGSLDALFGGVSGVGANALTKTSKFIGVGCVPHGFVRGVSAKLAIFHHCACCSVKDWGCK